MKEAADHSLEASGFRRNRPAVKPLENLTVTAGVGLQWRQTTNDAIYVQPSIPLPGTAGRGGSWTGVYEQLRIDYAFPPNLSGAIELVHFDVGDAISKAGGSDGNHVGIELKAAW